MPIECYALVVFEKELDDFAVAWNTAWGKDAESAVVREIEYHFCHLKLVQSPTTSQMRNGKLKNTVPKPKWEVVETLDDTITEKHFHHDQLIDAREFAEDGTVVHEGDLFKRWGGKEQTPLLLECTVTYNGDSDKHEFLAAHQRIVTIDDRRVQLKQIRYLFPETAKMPLAIALDYVRDRI